jgi:WD40 repeat protein
MVLFCNSNQKLEIRSLETGQIIRTIDIPGEENKLFYADFLRNNDKIVTGFSNAIRVWDIKTGRQTLMLDLSDIAKETEFRSFYLSPDSNRIVGKYKINDSINQYLRLWDLDTGRFVADLIKPFDSMEMGPIDNNLIYTQDGQKIVVNSNRAVGIWNAGDGQKIQQFDVKDNVKTILLSPDNKRLLTIPASHSSDYECPALWSLETGQQLEQFWSRERISSADFNSDGSRIATGSDNGTTRVWRVLPSGQALIDYARSVVPRKLTAEERDIFGI